jgi:proton-dependent oligopeptide transporter, POT family
MPEDSAYLTKPLPSPDMPRGIPYIVGNEAAERFSYYGMVTILFVFMTRYLRGPDGMPATMSETDAKVYYHEFQSAVYFFPVLGALISDGLLGKYRTILTFSIVYCLGHLALAIDDTRTGLLIGLALIAVGSGGIKPCVSAHVGDQFGQANQHLLPKVFAWFYFAINFGSFFSTLLTPWLLSELAPAIAPHVAFGVPGVLMFVATIVFWLGRHKFVHVPPGGRRFLRETFSKEGLRAMGKLLILYAFIAIFFSLYNQTGSAWVLQAEKMDRHWLGIEWLSSQVQAVNPILILVFIPLFSYVLYPAISRFFPLTPLRKIGIGLFLTSLAFVVSAWIEQQISEGKTPTIAWQLLAYLILTVAEVFVYLTGLEFSYSQAPRRMKSVIMSFYLLAISAGNLLTAAINAAISNPDGSSKLPGADYYWFFAGLMAATAALFVFVAYGYREKTYIQPEAAA